MYLQCIDDTEHCFVKKKNLGYICFWNKAPFFCDMFLCFITLPQMCFVLVGGVNVEVLGVTGCFSCRSVPCGGLLYSPGGLQGCIPHALFPFAVVNLLHLRISPRALSLMHILWESLWLKASLSRINVAVWLVFVRPSLPSVNNVQLHSAACITSQIKSCACLLCFCVFSVSVCLSVICKSNQLVLTDSVLMNFLIVCAIVFRFLASDPTHLCT